MKKNIVSGVALIFLLFAVPQYFAYCKVTLASAELKKQELMARAEIARAGGVAESNKIIGESLAGKENYLKYLWIQALATNRNKTLIYVPTEANIPITEAMRLQPN